jgi:glycosyltransferase involved in cell wall biosynthesis
VSAPALSVVVPTRGRPGYLGVALDSLARQRLDGGEVELIVVDDGSVDGETAAATARAGAELVRLDPPRGLNAARNEGARRARSELVAYVDDDVDAPPGWAAAVVAGAARHPGAEAFGGPIRARFEGPTPRGCGREPPPITTLDLGGEDREAELVWGSNMALRRAALDRVGWFDETISGGGDEEEWLDRLRAAGGTVVYLAAAGLDHRRAGADARLRSLSRGAFGRGRAMRRYDTRVGKAPSLAYELRVLAGCGWHTARRACPQGIVMGAHALGRAVEAARGR